MNQGTPYGVDIYCGNTDLLKMFFDYKQAMNVMV